MRVKDGLKRAGFFWLPDSADNKVPGILTVENGGSTTLEITGSFDNETASRVLATENSLLKRIIGRVEKDGYVTLENSIYTKRNLSLRGNIHTSSIYSSMTILGAGYEAEEEITLFSYTFSVDGLETWVQRSGFEFNFHDNNDDFDIKYTHPKDISIPLSDGLELIIMFGFNIPSEPGFSEVKIEQTVSLQLTSTTERPYTEFRDLSNKISKFLSFALDTTVCIFNVSGRSKNNSHERNGSTFYAPMSFFYESIPFLEFSPAVEQHRILFGLNDVDHDLHRIVNSWLNSYEKIRPALDLYFSATAGDYKYLDGRFLALAQGLETYQRRTSNETLMNVQVFRSMVAEVVWRTPRDMRKFVLGRLKHGNEINLGQRITKIIAPFSHAFGNSKARRKLIRNIVDTRNYMTHFSPELQSKALTGKDLLEATFKLEALFQLNMLNEIGFTNVEIGEILKHNFKLKWKIQ